MSRGLQRLISRTIHKGDRTQAPGRQRRCRETSCSPVPSRLRSSAVPFLMALFFSMGAPAQAQTPGPEGQSMKGAVLKGKAPVNKDVLKVSLPSIEALNDFVVKKLRNVEGVDKTETMVILGEY